MLRKLTWNTLQKLDAKIKIFIKLYFTVIQIIFLLMPFCVNKASVIELSTTFGHGDHPSRNYLWQFILIWVRFTPNCACNSLFIASISDKILHFSCSAIKYLLKYHGTTMILEIDSSVYHELMS